MTRKVKNVACPKCKQSAITATEIRKGFVSSYSCDNCGSQYDAELYHDFSKNEHWWIGKLRNPDYWNTRNETLEEGLREFEARDAKGIKQYLGKFPIEKIPLKK